MDRSPRSPNLDSCSRRGIPFSQRVVFRKVLEFLKSSPASRMSLAGQRDRQERGQYWDWLLQTEGETGRTEKGLALSKVKTTPEHLVFNTDNTTWNQMFQRTFCRLCLWIPE